MATSVNVGLANLQKPSTQKSLKAKLRARLHLVVALVGLGVVAAVGTYIAKRGLPDIDPVKVRGARAETKRAAVSPVPPDVDAHRTEKAESAFGAAGLARARLFFSAPRDRAF